MSSKNGPEVKSSVIGIMASVAETASPLLAMTGVGIPLALVLHTCSMGVKMLEDNNKLKETVKKCNTFTLKWSREYMINSVTIQKYKDLTNAFYMDDKRQVNYTDENNNKVIDNELYQWKYGKIKKILTQVRSMDKVMNLITQLNSYLEYCLDNGKIDNWLTGGLAKKEVIDDLVQEIIVEFSFFEKETLRMKDEVSIIINMDLKRARAKFNLQTGGSESFWSSLSKGATKLSDGLSKGATKLSEGATKLAKHSDAATFFTNVKDHVVNKVKAARENIKELRRSMTEKNAQKDGHKEEIYMLDEIYYSILEDETYNKAKDINEYNKVEESKYNSIEEMKNGLVEEINKNKKDDEKIKKLPEGDKEAMENLIDKEKNKNDAIEKSAKSNRKWFSWFRKDNSNSNNSDQSKKSWFRTSGGLSTRRKRKRRPKFHQVRSYKQRPKQHRLK